MIAVPVPKEFAMDGKNYFIMVNAFIYSLLLNDYWFLDEYMNRIILDALNKAQSSGISGKEITPFLLNVIGKLTSNKSLETSTATK